MHICPAHGVLAETIGHQMKCSQHDETTVFSCEDAAQQVLMSVRLSVRPWSICNSYSIHSPECSRMFQNVPECMQYVPECSRMHAICSRMFQHVPECMQNLKSYRMHTECSRMIQNACSMFQNVPECSRMHAECSRMFQNACRMF